MVRYVEDFSESIDQFIREYTVLIFMFPTAFMLHAIQTEECHLRSPVLELRLGRSCVRIAPKLVSERIRDLGEDFAARFDSCSLWSNEKKECDGSITKTEEL